MSRSVRLILPVLAFLPWASASRAQAQEDQGKPTISAEETCMVSGLVVSRVENAPLKSATVHIWSGDSREHTIATKTTADGRFELRNVPAGQYHLSVSRRGYYDAQYGQNKPDDPGATFTLRPGQRMSDLVFKLGRAGVITGRVFDEDGEPMSNVSVEALRSVYEKDRRELRPVTQSESNDLGEFRLFGLAPGRYYVSAQLSEWNQVVGDREFTKDLKTAERGYTKIYYPNALDPGAAAPLTVKEGTEISSTDILMKQISVYRVSGKVLNQVTPQRKPPVEIMLFRKNTGDYWYGMGSRNMAKGDGSFELAEVAPGEYTLVAMLFDDQKAYSTRMDLEVNTADIDGLLVAIVPGVTIPGTVRWEGKPDLSRPSLSVSLESAQNTVGWGGGQATADDNWQFTLKEVSDGTFKVDLFGLGKDCYVKEVRYGDTLLADTEVRVRGAGGNLEITASCQGARIDGIVTNKDELAAAGAWAVAVPEEGKRKFLRLYKSFTTDQYGHFELHGLAPGKYKLFSWQGIEENAWHDPEFLKDYEDQGQTIEVRDRDKKNLDLKLIASQDTDAKTD